MIFVLMSTIFVPDTSHSSLYFGLAILMLPVLIGLVCFAKNIRQRNQDDLYFLAARTFLRVKYDLKKICILNEQDGWQFWSSKVYKATGILYESLRTALIFNRESPCPVFVYYDEISGKTLRSVVDRVVKETELSNLSDSETLEWIKRVILVYLLISRLDWSEADSKYVLPDELLEFGEFVDREVDEDEGGADGSDRNFVVYQKIQSLLTKLLNTCPETLIRNHSVESPALEAVSG